VRSRTYSLSHRRSDLIKRQLAGRGPSLGHEEPGEQSQAARRHSTDEITPAHYCFYFDETLGEIPYLGLKCGGVVPIAAAT